jgi:tetratricopeptide (TPR) repeat protein
MRWRQLTLVFVVPAVLLAAQTPGRTATPPGLQAATRALIEGRFAEVEELVAKLDQRDPSVVAVRARAEIARGRYDQAEGLLRPAAERAPTSAAALELGLLEQMLGRSGAGPLLARVASLATTSDDATEIARGARALRGLGRFQNANQAYREASARAPRDPDIHTAWGELFLEKYNTPEALKSFQLATQADPKWVPALVGTARALADDNPPQAASIAKKALEINPSSVDTFVFLAGEAADADHRAEAREHLTKALSVNPSSLETHSLLAALAYIEDKRTEYDAEVAKTLAIAPQYGELYRTVGKLAAHNYRYDEAVELMRRGLAIDRTNPRVLADLGAELLRTGDEPAARDALESAFKSDPFDVSTFNMLRLLDTVDKFDVVQDGDIILKMSKAEMPVLKEYALALAHRALGTISARYEFTPRPPTLIEVFTKHDDFAVRTVGLPGMIGALGVCFGRVVALDSPKARPPGTYQWEATLWHELAHVVTVQLSNQRVPRWLTEGISVFEEGRERPEWARGMDVQFAQLLNRGETVKLRDLNAAFTDPAKVNLAYFEGALVVEHLVDLYGDAGLRRMLRAYGQGLDTDSVLKSVLNTSFDDLQAGFDKAMERKFGAIGRALAVPDNVDVDKMNLEALRKFAADNPGSFPGQMALGRELQKGGQVDEAAAAYERAAALVPIAAGRNSPHALLARIALDRKETARAIAELQALIKVDFDNVEAARQLASLLRESGVDDPARLASVYERIIAIDPFDVDAHSRLGRVAMRRGDAVKAALEFRTTLALAPVDRAAALTDLAESYLLAGKPADAKKQTLAALEIAPSYERAQDLLLKLAGR